ncbi:MAG: DUF5615 family PIN-like protein [Candidatus Latescibacterota bacterium]
MALRLFADHCVPTSVIAGLERRGHIVQRLREHLPVESPDDAVIACAQQMGCILLSLDGHFSDIAQYPPGRFHGIVALQARNHPEVFPAIAEQLAAYLDRYPDSEHYAGVLLLVEPARIRIRRWPAPILWSHWYRASPLWRPGPGPPLPQAPGCPNRTRPFLPAPRPCRDCWSICPRQAGGTPVSMPLRGAGTGRAAARGGRSAACGAQGRMGRGRASDPLSR